MSERKEKTNGLIMVNSLVSPGDVSRALREVQKIDELIYQSKLRKHPGSENEITPSAGLKDLMAANKLSLQNEQHRKSLIQQLQTIRQDSPVVHVSFAVEPSSNFLRSLTSWFRDNTMPNVLIETGLQPSIAVGCMIRTNNKIYDLSLRSKFQNYRQLLVDKLAEKAAPKEGRQ